MGFGQRTLPSCTLPGVRPGRHIPLISARRISMLQSFLTSGRCEWLLTTFRTLPTARSYVGQGLCCAAPSYRAQMSGGDGTARSFRGKLRGGAWKRPHFIFWRTEAHYGVSSGFGLTTAGRKVLRTEDSHLTQRHTLLSLPSTRSSSFDSDADDIVSRTEQSLLQANCGSAESCLRNVYLAVQILSNSMRLSRLARRSCLRASWKSALGGHHMNDILRNNTWSLGYSARSSVKRSSSYTKIITLQFLAVQINPMASQIELQTE